MRKIGEDGATWAAWVYDPARRRLWTPNGTAVLMSSLDARLLELFLAAPSRVVTDETIRAALDGARLRQKFLRFRQLLSRHVGEPAVLRTLGRVGWVLTAEVAVVGTRRLQHASNVALERLSA